MATRKAQPQELPPEAAVVALVAGVLLTIIGVWLGLPAGAGLWAGLFAAAMIYPRPELTGKDPVTKAPAAEGPAERELMDRYRRYSYLKWALFNPGVVVRLEPCLPVVWLTMALFALLPATWTWSPAVSAILAGLAVGAWFYAIARAGIDYDRQPKVPITTIRQSWGGAPTLARVAIGTAAGVAAGVLAFLVNRLPEVAQAKQQMLDFLSLDWTSSAHTVAAIVVLGVLGGVVPWVKGWYDRQLEHWRAVVGLRAIWQTRWGALRLNRPPRLVDFEDIGPSRNVHFDTAGQTRVNTFLQMSPEQWAQVEPGYVVVPQPSPRRSEDGQPIPGTVNPQEFQLSMWPGHALPRIDTFEESSPVLLHAIQCAASAAGLPTGDAPQIETVVRLTDDAPHIFAAVFAGVSGEAVKQGMGASIGAMLGCDALTDPHLSQGQGVLFLGDIWGGKPRLDRWPELGADAARVRRSIADDHVEDLVEAGIAELDRLARREQWDQMWQAATKSINAPVMQDRLHAFEPLANGREVETQLFSMREGQVATDFCNQKIENALATSRDPHAFVYVHRYLPSPKQKPSAHQQGLVVHRCKDQPPSIDRLCPVDHSGAPGHVLAAKIARAFEHCRLARPELAEAICLTTARSRDHVWQVRLWLYDGVTLADVRRSVRKLRADLQVPFLRVGAADGGCLMALGADPTTRGVILTSQETQERLLAFGWEEYWADAGVIAEDGSLPGLVSAKPLPDNPKVTTLTFTIPPGKSLGTFRGNKEKVSSLSGNAFVEVRHNKSDPGLVDLLVARESPLQFPEPMRWDHPTTLDAMPMASSVEGKTVCFRRKDHAHVMFVGGSGSGKTQAALTLLTSALRAGAEVYVGDVAKGGADFKYAEDWATAFAGSTEEVVAMLEAITQEKDRRVALNKQYGTSSVRDLPAELVPKPMLVFLDEFFGMIAQSGRPGTKAEASPELEAERLRQVMVFEAKKRIAFLVGRIAAEARSGDIHLIVVTQKFTKDMLDGVAGLADLKTNMNRVLLGKANSGDRMSALRAPMDAPDPGAEVPQGRGVWEPVDGPAELVQFWFAPTEEHMDRLQEIPQPCKLDLTPFMPKTPGEGMDFVEESPLIKEVTEVTETLDFDFGFLSEDPPPADGEVPVEEPVDAVSAQEMTVAEPARTVGWGFGQAGAETAPASVTDPVAPAMASWGWESPDDADDGVDDPQPLGAAALPENVEPAEEPVHARPADGALPEDADDWGDWGGGSAW